jgi:hypothetical protein
MVLHVPVITISGTGNFLIHISGWLCALLLTDLVLKLPRAVLCLQMGKSHVFFLKYHRTYLHLLNLLLLVHDDKEEEEEKLLKKRWNTQKPCKI